MKTVYAGAVIAAGGLSQRMEGINKQRLEIDGVPVLVRSILAIAAVEEIREIVVVARPEMFDEIQGWKQTYSLPDFLSAAAGESRRASVQNGIDKLSQNVEYFVIHDGARPFAEKEMILRCLDAAKQHGAATAAVKTKDTIKVAAEDGSIADTPNRDMLYLTQTPQIFRADLYRKAALLAKEQGKEYTDDCQLAEVAGYPVWLAQGDYRNIKITTPEDIAVAQALAKQGGIGKERKQEEKQMEIRTGHGYDVHRLVEGRKLILGGVLIPWERGLLGHSDADVLTHAVMDSLLGAAGLGDIGRHFPDTDPDYAGADSIMLLERVWELIVREGYRISNIDCTVIAQRPKLKDYIPQMRKRIAEACRIAQEQVNVKATTEEKLGFTGSEEGISAHSVCIITR